MVTLNADRIMQVIDNIVSNAISFSPDNGTIHLQVAHNKAGGRVVLDILDDGPGIPPNKTEAVFDRFYSERPSGESFGQHSGLGLSIARQIAAAHNGSLIASNRPEGGACFRLDLPLALSK